MATNARARTRIAHLGCGVGAAAVLAFIANGSPMLAARAGEPARWAAPQRLPQTAAYRYDVSVRIRAVIFSITRNGVGAARIVRGTSRDGARSYELLIGSDPARTPMGINRWGYIAETVDGSAAQLVGVMTESEEQTVADATASVKGQAGNHRFKAILGSVDGREASALVVRAGFPENFTFRDVETVLARLPEGSPTARLRIPDGTHPGFLGAVADIVHASVETFSRLACEAPARTSSLARARLRQFGDRHPAAVPDDAGGRRGADGVPEIPGRGRVRTSGPFRRAGVLPSGRPAPSQVVRPRSTESQTLHIGRSREQQRHADDNADAVGQAEQVAP